MTYEAPSAEQISKHYKACLDSVAFLKADKPEYMSDAAWTECVTRNVQHLEHMLQQPWWGSYNTAEFQAAISLHK